MQVVCSAWQLDLLLTLASQDLHVLFGLVYILVGGLLVFHHLFYGLHQEGEMERLLQRPDSLK